MGHENTEDVHDMSMIRIQLVGCNRYNYKGELYEKESVDGKAKVYMVGESKAAILLRDKDEYERPYFKTYEKPAKSKAQRVAEAAAAAAAKAATEEAEAVVERPDGSEQKDDVVIAVPQPEEVEVDKDDDASLDNDDEPNPNEVDLGAEEDEDRSDGSEVQV